MLDIHNYMYNSHTKEFAAQTNKMKYDEHRRSPQLIPYINYMLMIAL